jgi:hypothetical protein
MAALEQVMKMREQGMSERQIIDSLKAQGINPKDINDALSQSQIKSAIDTTNPNQLNPTITSSQQAPHEELGIPQQSTPEISPPTNPMNQEPQVNQMQHSMMTQETPTSPMPNQPSAMPNQPSQIPNQFQQPETAQQSTMEYPQSNTMQQPTSEYPAPEFYQEQEQYPTYEYQQSTDIETITEVAEQIIEEKIEKMKQQTSSLSRVKEELTIKVEKMNQRLEKLENLFNELQMAILGKIKDYSQGLKGVSNELHATQEAFSKVLNPVIDQQRANPPEQETPKPRGRPKKDSEDFEKYLR